MLSCHSASSPFLCHDETSFKAEIHQRACNRCGRLSGMSVSPPKSLQSLRKVIWHVSVSPICILLLDFQCLQKKQTNNMILVGLISQANGIFKLHTVKALHPKLSWKRLLLSLLLFVSFLQVTVKVEWLKSSSSYSKAATGDSSNRGEVSFRSDILRIFNCHDFTEVHPVLAAGGRFAHLPEPHAEPLETDSVVWGEPFLS